MNLLELFVGAILVNNIVLARFLGICPFLGVSSKMSTARGMSLAVIFVMLIASAATWTIYHGLLVPLNLSYLTTLSFILVIAAVVQLVEIIMKKLWPPLYKSLGIFLPLITTNCAVLGVTVINIQEGYAFIPSMVHTLGTSLGFLLALILFSGMRERMQENGDIPRVLDGLPISLITAGLMAMAFMGFQGLF